MRGFSIEGRMQNICANVAVKVLYQRTNNETTWIQPRQCLCLSTPGHVSRCLDVSSLAGSLRGSGNQLSRGHEPRFDDGSSEWEQTCHYESWVVPAGVPSALADIGGGVEANY